MKRSQLLWAVDVLDAYGWRTNSRHSTEALARKQALHNVSLMERRGYRPMQFRVRRADVPIPELETLFNEPRPEVTE